MQQQHQQQLDRGGFGGPPSYSSYAVGSAAGNEKNFTDQNASLTLAVRFLWDFDQISSLSGAFDFTVSRVWVTCQIVEVFLTRSSVALAIGLISDVRYLRCFSRSTGERNLHRTTRRKNWRFYEGTWIWLKLILIFDLGGNPSVSQQQRQQLQQQQQQQQQATIVHQMVHPFLKPNSITLLNVNFV